MSRSDIWLAFMPPDWGAIMRKTDFTAQGKGDGRAEKIPSQTNTIKVGGGS